MMQYFGNHDNILKSVLSSHIYDSYFSDVEWLCMHVIKQIRKSSVS